MTNISVVLFQRDKWWVAQCLQHDIGAQAYSIQDVMYELQRSIVGYLTVCEHLKREPFLDMPAAPDFYWKKFQGTSLTIESTDAPISAPVHQVPRAEYRLAA